MSTLVQHNNSPHYPQSIIMNSGEGATRQQRPTNNPSKNLLPHELQCLYEILGQSRVVKTKKLFILFLFEHFFLDFSNRCCPNFTWQ
jgi:hypothetical protein